jgi:carboxyl-terminal processing protease
MAAHGITVAVSLVACLISSSANGNETATAPISAAVPSDANDSVDVAKLYDAVIETIERKFYDPRVLQELDWSARAKALRPSVLASRTTQDAARKINELLSELKTSHTGLFTPDDYDYYILLDIVGAGSQDADLRARHFWGNGPYYLGIGVFTREIDGRHFVDSVLEGSPADKAGLKYGDEILSVDGGAYNAIAAFRGKLSATVDVAIRRHESDEPQHLRIEVIPIRPAAAFSDATRTSARIIEHIGHRLGYVHVWASHEANSFKTVLARFTLTGSSSPSAANPSPDHNSTEDDDTGIDGLIVDMRGRVGGNLAVAKAFLEAMDPDARNYLGEWRTFSRGLSNPQVWFGSPLHDNEYRGRSALLIDQHTRSAAEVMAFGFQHQSFGPVVGTPSAGAVVSGSLSVMPGDLLLYTAVTGMTFDKKNLEGVGVTPDYRVERPLPYADGADPVLDAAADLLAKQDQK